MLNRLTLECRAIARFQYLVGHDTFLGGRIFAFATYLKQIFLGATKFGEVQKKFGGNCP